VIGQAIQSGRLFQHPPAAILNYHFAQTTLFFPISDTKKDELKILILVKFFTIDFRNLFICKTVNCGDMLLASPCLLYYFYRNVQ